MKFLVAALLLVAQSTNDPYLVSAEYFREPNKSAINSYDDVVHASSTRKPIPQSSKDALNRRGYQAVRGIRPLSAQESRLVFYGFTPTQTGFVGIVELLESVKGDDGAYGNVYELIITCESSCKVTSAKHKGVADYESVPKGRGPSS
jgi:hypothetical protein